MCYVMHMLMLMRMLVHFRCVCLPMRLCRSLIRPLSVAVTAGVISTDRKKTDAELVELARGFQIVGEWGSGTPTIGGKSKCIDRIQGVANETVELTCGIPWLAAFRSWVGGTFLLAGNRSPKRRP